uniref:FYVE-type zinc finger domain-containing protein n=1 Tax=Romanomermis culicivorax TaxID=13658 RepID=A0A915IXZ9_ROMCU
MSNPNMLKPVQNPLVKKWRSAVPLVSMNGTSGVARRRAAPHSTALYLAYVCQKNCGLETLDSHNQPIFLCKLCSETREMWKKTGAWFYQDVPKYVLPDHQRSASSEPGWSRGSRTCPVASSLSAQLQAQSANSHSGSLANWNDDWDSSNRPSPGSSPSRKSQSSWGASNGPRPCMKTFIRSTLKF